MTENTNQATVPASAASGPEHNSRHKVRCVDHKFARASTGNRQIAVLCEVTEGPHKGYMCPWYGVFVGDAEEFTIRGMRALGFKGDNILDVASMYKGEALATFEHDKNKDGKLVIKIAWLNEMGVIVKDQLEGAELQRFAQEMRARLGNSRGGQQSAQGAQQLPPQQQYQQQLPQGQQQGWDGYRDTRNGQQRRNDPPPRDDAPPPWADDRGRRY